MPLKYLIDENLRGKFPRALIASGESLDVLEVGAAGAPSLGTTDPELLAWCEDQDRVLVSLDFATLPLHLRNHLAVGATSPGVFLIRRTRTWEEIMEYLALCAAALHPHECANQCIYIPF